MSNEHKTEYKNIKMIYFVSIAPLIRIYSLINKILSIYDYLFFVSSFPSCVVFLCTTRNTQEEKILFDCFNFILFRYIIVPHSHTMFNLI